MAFGLSYLLLLLLFLIHEVQSCPKSIYFNCPDYKETSLNFPFTNSSFPECGTCVFTCERSHTMMSCRGLGDPDLQYLVTFINPSNHTLVVKLLDPCEAYSTATYSNDNFPSIGSVSYTTLKEFETVFICPYENRSRTFHVHPFHICDDDHLIVYGPYSDPPPKSLFPPQAKCSSKSSSLSIQYNISSSCQKCLDEGSRCYDDFLHGQVHCDDRNENMGKGWGVILGTALPGSVIIVALVFYFQRSRKKNQSGSLALSSRSTSFTQSFETFLENCGSLAPKRYKYPEIKKMTNSFKEKLGEGGYGGVFKGKLLDGRLVAVKLLKHSKGNGEDFINEVASISRTNHVNVVTLLGFCCAGQNRALVYEFMANGSLEKFINDKTDNYGQLLPLETLFHVALGIARGLEYLHRGCKTRILHFDIKPHNILLDEHFCPKISDFGLAKVSQQTKRSKVSMSGARGTIGYIAPEMFCRNFGDVSHKSDVYSYGMMVLEMIGSRKRPDAKAECSSELIFPEWIYEQLEHGDDAEIDGAAPVLNEEEKTLKKKMIIVSLWCIQTVPSCRPSMSRVLQMLEGSLELIQIPPMPSLSSPPRPQLDPSGSSIVPLHTESWGTS